LAQIGLVTVPIIRADGRYAIGQLADGRG